MKKSLLLMALLSVAIVLNAQIRFQHVTGGPAYDDAQEIIQTADQGFIMCGTTESFGAGQADILVVKTDDAGVVQWSKAYGSPGNDFGAGIRKTPSGGYIIAGYSYGLSTDTLTDDFLLIRINSSGNVLWAKTYGGPANDEAHAVTVMPDSGFVVAGTTASFGSVTNQAGYVVRTDANGNLLWSKAIAQNSDQQLFSADATPDGGCIVAGYTYVSSFRLFDIFLARLNANGSKQWVKRFGGSSSEQAFSVQQSNTGGFVVSGYTASFGTGQDDTFILRTDENGDLVFFNTYGTADSERARSMIWGSNNGIVLTGQAQVNGPSGLMDNNFLLKTDTSGAIVWSKTYGPSQNLSLAYDVAYCNDGGYVMAGITGGFGAQQNDIYLVKTNNIAGSGCHQVNAQMFASSFTPSDSSDGAFSNGGVEATVTVIKTDATLSENYLCNSTGVGMMEMGQSVGLMISPNPASSLAWLSTAEPVMTGTGIEITGVNGKTVLRFITESYTNKIMLPLESLESGFYFVWITGSGRTDCVKLIIL